MKLNFELEDCIDIDVRRSVAYDFVTRDYLTSQQELLTGTFLVSHCSVWRRRKYVPAHSNLLSVETRVNKHIDMVLPNKPNVGLS